MDYKKSGKQHRQLHSSEPGWKRGTQAILAFFLP
jgi:hypothetical protein